MSVRNYTFAVLAILVVSFVTVCYLVINGRFFHSFIDLERREAVKDNQRWISGLLSEADALSMITLDWSSWDDTYRYAVDHNQGYADSNLADTTFTDIPLNLLFIVDAAGDVVYHRIAESDTLKPLEIAEFPPDHWDASHPLLQGQDVDGEGIRGLMTTELGPVVVAAWPILTSEGTGPVHGTLVMGRLLSQETCTALNERTAVEARCAICEHEEITAEYAALTAAAPDPATGPLVHVRDQDTLLVYDTVPGIDGGTVLTVCTVIPREITHEGHRAIAAVITAVVLACLILMVAILAILERTILSRVIRLSRFSQHVASGSDLSIRADIHGRDEIGQLAGDLNQMLGSLERSQQAMLEAERNRTELETIKRMTATYAHEINNPLTGVISAIQILQDESACRQDVTDLLDDAFNSANRIKGVTMKMQEMSKPRYKPYLGHSEIVDIHGDGTDDAGDNGRDKKE